MFKVRFDIVHKGCWGSEISEKFPGMRFSSVDVRWVKGDVAHILVADLIEAKGDPAKFNDIIKYLKKRKFVTKVDTISKDEHKIHIRTLTQHTKKHTQFSGLFFDNHLFMIAPVKFEKNYEKWTLATAEKKNILKVYELLKEKHQVKLVYLKEEIIGEDLTVKQREVLTLAKHFGYYEWPRKKGATEIAKLSKISKTVFLSHLRKAENKIMDKFFE
jgi:predicted DNA binding protein